MHDITKSSRYEQDIRLGARRVPELLFHFFPPTQRPDKDDNFPMRRRCCGLAAGVRRNNALLEYLFRRKVCYGQPRVVRFAQLA